MTLTPGQPVVVKVTLANTGTTVDHLSLFAEGVPQSWVQGPGREVQLNPGQQETATLTIQAPRLPNSRAGMYPVTLRARSRENPGDSGSASVRWTVAPFTSESLALRPTRVRARRTARFNITLQNSGNAPVQYALAGEDPEEKLQYQFAWPAVTVDPGASSSVPTVIHAPWKISGQPEMRDFRISARPANGGQPQVAAGQIMHASLLPGWLPPPLLALIAAGVVVLASLFATGVLPGALANIGASPTATTLSAVTSPTTGGAATPTVTATATPQPILTSVNSSNPVTVGANSCYDLDGGGVVPSSSTDADFCWNVVDPTRTLAPTNSAMAGIFGATTEPGFQDCLNFQNQGQESSNPIDGSPGSNNIPNGTFLCFRTSSGHTAMMHIDIYDMNLQIDYKTWKS